MYSQGAFDGDAVEKGDDHLGGSGDEGENKIGRRTRDEKGFQEILGEHLSHDGEGSRLKKSQRNPTIHEGRELRWKERTQSVMK